MESMGELFVISFALKQIVFALKFQTAVIAIVGMLIIAAILRRK